VTQEINTTQDKDDALVNILHTDWNFT